MSRSLFKRPAVLADLEEIAVRIARGRPRTAARFLKAAERTFELLTIFPRLGGAHPSLPEEIYGIRCFPVRRFRTVVVFYRPLANGVEIVRVLHGTRNLPQIFDEEI